MEVGEIRRAEGASTNSGELCMPLVRRHQYSRREPSEFVLLNFNINSFLQHLSVSKLMGIHPYSTFSQPGRRFSNELSLSEHISYFICERLTLGKKRSSAHGIIL